MLTRDECLLKGLGTVKEVSAALANLPPEEQQIAGRVMSFRFNIETMMQEPETRRACIALCCALLNEQEGFAERLFWVDAGNKVAINGPEDDEYAAIMRAMFCSG